MNLVLNRFEIIQSENQSKRENQQEKSMKYIPISKEKLEELYVDKKMTTFEIAEVYNVDKQIICNKLEEFQIDINPSQRKYAIIKKIPLSKEQKEFIIGSTLGDGSVILSGRRTNAYFKVSHCEKQKDYLLWKKMILGNLTNVVNKYEDTKSNSITYGIHTVAHHEMNFFRKLFYDNNKKVVRPEVGLHLSPFGLAVWFMDDGNKYSDVTYRLSTDAFTQDENHLLRDIIKANFDLNVKVCEYEKNNKKYYYISINKRNSFLMTEIISPYVAGCMRYKLIYDCSSTTECQNELEGKPSDSCDIV